MKTEVFCTLQVEGTHNWPGCPYDEVAYLRDMHRHVFHIKAYKEVFHDDRDQEFIMLKHGIHRYLVGKYWGGWTTQHWKDPISDESSGQQGGQGLCTFGAMSCEMIARELIEHFGLSKCEVNEDGENGAVLTV